MLARAHQLLLRYKVAQSIAAYYAVLVHWPDSKEALIGRAQTQLFFRYWGPALASATSALHFYPDEPDLIDIQVGSLYQLGRWESALQLVRNQRDTRAPVVDVLGTEASILARMGNTSAAAAIYRRAKDNAPGA